MSRPVTVTVPHQLGKAEARNRVASSVGQLRDQFAALSVSNFQQAWSGDRMNFQAQALGQTITGGIDVNDADIRIEVALPGLLGMFSSKIAGSLRRQGTLLLEKK
jgi:putative polyhydroxyalkanoate system protein